MEQQSLFVRALKHPDSRDEAFSSLVSEYKERLYWHIRKIVIDHDDANDVVQNTFVKIHLNIESFKENSSLYTWMYRIATNESISFINKRAKERKVSISEIHSELATTLQSDVYFSGDEIQHILQKAIATLPTKQQLVFNMKYFDELKYSQISEILNTSVGALKASYFHAVKKIETYIQQHNN